MYFKYPSSQEDKFYNLSAANVASKSYNLTMQNYEQNNRHQTTLSNGNVIDICTVIIENSISKGVVCLGIDIETLINQITTSLSVPEF